MEQKNKDNRNPSARTACSAHYIFGLKNGIHLSQRQKRRKKENAVVHTF